MNVVEVAINLHVMALRTLLPLDSFIAPVFWFDLKNGLFEVFEMKSGCSTALIRRGKVRLLLKKRKLIGEFRKTHITFVLYLPQQEQHYYVHKRITQFIPKGDLSLIP